MAKIPWAGRARPGTKHHSAPVWSSSGPASPTGQGVCVPRTCTPQSLPPTPFTTTNDLPGPPSLCPKSLEPASRTCLVLSHGVFIQMTDDTTYLGSAGSKDGRHSGSDRQWQEELHCVDWVSTSLVPPLYRHLFFFFAHSLSLIYFILEHFCHVSTLLELYLK